MGLLTLISRGIYWGIGAVQAAGELYSAGKRLIRQVRDGAIPANDTDSEPLTMRDVELQKAQIEAATSHKVKS